MPKNQHEDFRDAGRPDSSSDAHNVVREINHRIANDLSLVSSLVRLHARRLARRRKVMTGEEAAALLLEVASRVESVARLHRLLSQEPGSARVSAADYLRELCDTLTSSVTTPGQIRFSARDDDPCVVAQASILPIALIVTEAITNAIKYSHPAGAPGRIEVGCRRDEGGRLVIEVEDDGVGLPDGFDPSRDGDLGFLAMRLLAEQIAADLTFESSPLGLRCSVRLAN